MSKSFLRQALVLVGLTALASCGGSGGGSSSDSTSTSQVTTTVSVETSSSSSTTTTIPESPKVAFSKLAKSMKAIDSSRISQGDCGTFGMLVTKSDLWFYEYDWKFHQWVDKSYLLGEPLGNLPIRVTTRDYNWDSVNDFLVAYGDNVNVMSSGREYGGIFAYAPYAMGDFKCKWGWVDLVGGVGSWKVMDWLMYDDSAGVIRAQDFHEGGGRTSGTLTYNMDDHYFSFTPDDLAE